MGIVVEMGVTIFAKPRPVFTPCKQESKMSIDGIVNVFDEIRDAGKRGELGDTELIGAVMDELEANSQLAKDILLKSLGEEKLVKLLLMIQKSISTLSITQGGKSLLFAEMSGELQSYTQTVILATIGTLIQDEIL